MDNARLIASERVTPNRTTNSMDGRIVIEPAKTLWLLGMIIGGLIGIAFYASWSAFAVFLILCAVTLCGGHSVGMHRLLIHRSFKTHIFIEHALVYLGTLVGMAGPFGMIRAHDMRDWHQRQTTCPPHPSHDAGFFHDGFWQLCCRFQLENPPLFEIEPKTRNDRFYKFLDRSWMAQQIPLAFILFTFGGIGWVLWGVCLRVAVSLIGHWAVGHFAHKNGHQSWELRGLPVQGYNLPRLAFVTFGESLHGNHHAFPHSAKLGLEPGQADLGFILIRILASLGLASDIKYPASEPAREGLARVEQNPDSKEQNFITA